ncbi:MAG TPA: 4Fe-4S single cluster domain-containing protein [Methylomusa anaerophila]|uniref:Pyruvate formate-lyase 1-activating enzyme n=1 Tax=Methylomusa anaerophila TaxID=1930071 RepID=A0A348AH12_9FIRM|nr:4Fe-4S single cluster domain-containing protein [Methylomusa anaerophila]BBB90360.1 pyruvate formate-lyase 1-activating enzyme [Methylomusa anaerophila]HML89294.1 4Fe-4S single cluster domain-containing protein [Methylomusa anaerophila]
MSRIRDLGARIINMAAFLPRSRVNGPGLRAVVWVQGCDRRCPGCFNQDMQPFTERELIGVRELADRILGINGIEGVTFSGGEPFEQAAALGELGKILHAKGLTVVAFSGYTLAELTAGDNPAWSQLLAVTDLLVAGPYLQDRPSDRYLCGSDNQEAVYLTDRLQAHPQVEKLAGSLVEFTIDGQGRIIVTGIVKEQRRSLTKY